jgi:uncharacterized protein
MGRARRSALAIGIPVLLVARSASAQQAPTLEELAAATYGGIEQAPATLVEGHWEGEPAIEGSASVPRIDLAADFRVTGDLDGDGEDEAVALLHSNFGGTGVFAYLAVVKRAADGALENVATAGIGDRVQLRSARVEGEKLVIETVEAGPEDAACCPGQKRLRIFALEGGRLVERSNEDRGRVSVADLEGVAWRLTRWAADEPLAEGVRIDLRVGGGELSGTSGCYRYRASVAAGELPGDLALASPLDVTRTTCPPPGDEAGGRYLDALENVDRFRYAAGRLVLDWSDNEQWGSLTFEAEPASARSGQASASPSFDCRRARGEVEQLICGDDELAALDRRMAEVWERALERWPVEEIQLQRATQRGWIQGRDACAQTGATEECVAFAYRSRIAELQIQSGQVQGAEPVLYVCQEDDARPFSAAFYGETDPPSVVLSYGDDQVVAFRAPSASGARFTAPDLEFWEHHGEATVDWFGTRLSCRVR